MQAQPYRIDIPQADLDDMRRRIASTRWPDDFGNEGWRYGVELGWLKDMARYWVDEYDWRAQEAAMNAYPNFRVELDGIPIHFLHVYGKGPNPKPLLLTHGWPWTFWDYRDMIGPLSDPAAYGGDAADAFDLIIPSLPGYGFSVPLRTTGVDVPRVAALWRRLMQDVLGYGKFFAAGGDWGAAVTAQLGHEYAADLLGIYLTFVRIPGLAPADIKPEDYAADEQWMIARTAQTRPIVTSHIAVHSSDPQTLAYALADSPIGTAAWLWERRRAWSDCDGDVLSVFDRDFLCTLASIYWLNGSVASAMRMYFEHFGVGASVLRHDRKPVIEAPTGCALFPKELAHVPRSIAERDINLKRWSLMPRGGHFAPAEQPALVTAELQAFFRELR